MTVEYLKQYIINFKKEHILNLKIFIICFAISFLLMILFILINYPYYKMSYGDKAFGIILRTTALNTLAIIIGWIPVVYLWPGFSRQYLLPFIAAIGALGCVGSRFIYPEIVPEQVGKTLLKLLEKEKSKDNY